MRSLRLFTSTRAVRELPNPPYYVSECQTGRQQHRLLRQRAHTRHEIRLRKPASSTTLCTYTSQASAAVADPTITTIQARMRAVNRAQYTTQTTMSKEPVVHSSFEDTTGTWQYVVADPSTNRAVVIDPVLDYDANTQTISTQTADGLLATISENGYHIEKILETHAHADHLTAASYLQQRLSSQQGFRPPICIGKRIREVQTRFAARYGIAAVEYENAFDHLFEDDEVFEIGQLEVKVMHLPGHTPDHIGYRIGGRCA
jgi:glyoxylase-like metal-dependent hydrolase (beta-lactamase superfamily II)